MPSFNIALRARPCFTAFTRKLFQVKVTCPKSVRIPRLQALHLAESLPEVQQIIDKHGSRLPLTIKIPIDLELVKQEISQSVYLDKTLCHGLLIVSEIIPANIVLKLNPRLQLIPQITLLSTAQSLREQRTQLTEGPPDAVAKPIVEGDFEAVLAVLGRDNKQAVKAAINEGKFNEIALRLDEPTRTAVIDFIRHGTKLMTQVLKSDSLKDYFHFLSPATKEKIIKILFASAVVSAKGICSRIDVALEALEQAQLEELETVLAQEKARVNQLINSLDFDAPLEVLVESGILSLLDFGTIEAVCQLISERARNKLTEDIRQCNLIENVKVRLLHILAEREAVYVAMFSFSIQIFSAALVAAWQRGAQVKILLDSREARQGYSQYENLAGYAKEKGFELRIFSTDHQHLKDVFCLGQRVMTTGSQNLSQRAFVRNLERLAAFSGDVDNFTRAAREFEEIFSRQGEFAPLPADIADCYYIWRSGLQGIRFLEKTPHPQVVEDVFRRLAEIKPGDHRKLEQLLRFAKGKKIEFVYDLTLVLHPFMAEIRDPVLVDRLLPDFLADVPPEFYWAPVHRGTTVALSSLIERTLMVLEYGSMICKYLGREDLLDYFMLAAIACDAYGKNNRLAAEELWKKITRLEGWERFKETLTILYTAVSERMEPDRKSKAEPLRKAKPLTEVDSMLRIIAAIARDLAKKKYLYLQHRVSPERSIQEILDVMLTNSYSIAGEGLEFLQQHSDLPEGPMPRRAQKMLRVAESLCDRFGYTDVNDPERHNILIAALRRGWGLDSRRKYRKPKNPQAPAINWIIHIAELIALHHETWVLTEEEVAGHLDEVELPNTQWQAQQLQAEPTDLAALTLEANQVSAVPEIDRDSLKQYSYLPTIAEAVKKIYPMLQTEERIDIYGDYDIDGQAGTAILVKTLQWLRAKSLHRKFVHAGMNAQEARAKAIEIAESTIGYYIPHKVNEGYGLNNRAVERLHDCGTKLLITVDCGINDKEAIAKAKQFGMEVVVTDHHSISSSDQLPEDTIIINPKLQLEADHPAHNLPGAAVAYKLALALAERGEIKLKDNFLDLLALAVLADKVKMTGENRSLAFFGMQRLASSSGNRGLTALLKAYKEPMNEGLVIGALAPKFDILGRVGMPSEGVELLLARDNNNIRRIISLMYDLERERKEEEARVIKEIREKLAFNPDKESAIALSGEWDRGMVSVIAQELAKEHGVPALVVTSSGLNDYMGAANPASGSIRTRSDINPLHILKRCEEVYQEKTNQPLFLSYGGHYTRSAGFRIEEDKISDLLMIYFEVSKEFEKAEREKIVYHARLKEGEISLADFKEFRKRLGPFGPGFKAPKFLVASQVVSWRVFGKNFQHIKGVLQNGTKFMIYDGNKPWVKRVLMENKGKVRMIVSLGIDRTKRQKEMYEELVFVVEDLK